jgi:hypothetical protein
MRNSDASRIVRWRERPDHTLQTTALVNEAYLRLADQTNPRWQNRAHFFAVAARAMRQILVSLRQESAAGYCPVSFTNRFQCLLIFSRLRGIRRPIDTVDASGALTSSARREIVRNGACRQVLCIERSGPGFGNIARYSLRLALGAVASMRCDTLFGTSLSTVPTV